MPLFRADLHIHSCLSPCGDLSASPKSIAQKARELGLHLIAITDHNSALNAPAFAAACRDEGLAAVFGIEITTREEVHALTLFPTVETALEAGKEAYERLESEKFDPESFGDQIWVNENEEIEGKLEKLLILGATDFSLDDLGSWCRRRSGILIPAHINRPAFGVLGQLGFLPEGPFEAVECTEPLNNEVTDPWPVSASSDAHRPEDIGRRLLEFEAPEAGFEALKNALATGNTRAVFENR
jgi:PHP family Zn ribbon phosphoesterase